MTRSGRSRAILDTGFSHNFGIAQRHLERWSGVNLPKIGETNVDGESVPQFKATLRVHRNESGKRWLTERTHPLVMDGGISVMADDLRRSPRVLPFWDYGP